MLKPYEAFLLATLLLTAGNAETFNQTRTTTLGPYLNLSDACLLVALVAVLFDRLYTNKSLRFNSSHFLRFSFLGLGCFVPGVLYGSMWSLVRSHKQSMLEYELEQEEAN